VWRDGDAWRVGDGCRLEKATLRAVAVEATAAATVAAGAAAALDAGSAAAASDAAVDAASADTVLVGASAAALASASGSGQSMGTVTKSCLLSGLNGEPSDGRNCDGVTGPLPAAAAGGTVTVSVLGGGDAGRPTLLPDLRGDDVVSVDTARVDALGVRQCASPPARGDAMSNLRRWLPSCDTTTTDAVTTAPTLPRSSTALTGPPSDA
jgi:hypothetical protein